MGSSVHTASPVPIPKRVIRRPFVQKKHLQSLLEQPHQVLKYREKASRDLGGTRSRESLEVTDTARGTAETR